MSRPKTELTKFLEQLDLGDGAAKLVRICHEAGFLMATPRHVYLARERARSRGTVIKSQWPRRNKRESQAKRGPNPATAFLRAQDLSLSAGELLKRCRQAGFNETKIGLVYSIQHQAREQERKQRRVRILQKRDEAVVHFLVTELGTDVTRASNLYADIVHIQQTHNAKLTGTT